MADGVLGVETHERPVVVAAGLVCLPNATADHAVVSQEVLQEHRHPAAIYGGHKEKSRFAARTADKVGKAALTCLIHQHEFAY